MSANIDALINQIVDDAERKVRADLAIVSSKIKKDFVDKAKEVVLLYYANYKRPPRIYERTYNLRDNVIDEDIFFHSLNGDSYGAWIQFNSSGMRDYTDGGDKVIIAENFMEGIHGNKNIFVEKNPAKDLMNEFQNNYKKNTLDGYFRNLGYRVK